MTHIRIIDVPSGDAPLHARAAWVGLDVPLAEIKGSQPRRIVRTVSVLKGWRLWLRNLRRKLTRELEEQPIVAYVVPAADALAMLRAARPEAAAWWQRNTPHLFEQGLYLLFEAHCCTMSPSLAPGAS